MYLESALSFIQKCVCGFLFKIRLLNKLWIITRHYDAVYHTCSFLWVLFFQNNLCYVNILKILIFGHSLNSLPIWYNCDIHNIIEGCLTVRVRYVLALKSTPSLGIKSLKVTAEYKRFVNDNALLLFLKCKAFKCAVSKEIAHYVRHRSNTDVGFYLLKA